MQSKSYLIIVVLYILYFLGKRIFEYFENRNLQSFDKDDLEMKVLVENAKIEAEKILEEQGVKKGRGYCHRLWNLQKKILKEKYKINWKTPAETDHVIYD